MVRRGRGYDGGGRADYGDAEDMADLDGAPGSSMRDIEAADAAVARIVEGLKPGSSAEEAFVRTIGQLTENTPGPMVEAAASVLRQLPPERARELMDRAKNPAILETAFSSPEDFVGAEADPTADFVERPVGAEEARKSQAAPRYAGEDPARRAQVEADRNARRRAESAAAGKQQRAPRFESHVMDNPATYGGARWAKRIAAEQRSPGERYLGRPFDQMAPYEQRQAMWLVNPKLAEFIDQFQSQQLGALRLDPQLTGLLTPEQRASILGVAPDQITPEVLQGIYGMQLPPDVIDQMGYAQRDQLVGRPALTPEQQDIVSQVQANDRGAQVRATAQADRQIGKWLGIAQSGDPNATIFLDDEIPWWSASHPYHTGVSLQYSPYAPTGEFLARLARVTNRYDDPSFVPLVAPMLERSVREQAGQPRSTVPGRGKTLTGAAMSREVLTPKSLGMAYLRRYSGDAAPFQQFTDIPIRRAIDDPGTLGNIEIDTTMQPTLPASDLDPMTMSTPEDIPVEPPVVPPEDQLGMMFDPTSRGRINPSVLAALLA